MGFSPGIRQDALVAAARHCCVCHRYTGLKIEVHHIEQEADGGSNTFENAIALCFDCHTDVGHYNDNHPKGSKFSKPELRKARNEWYKIVEEHKIQAPENSRDQTDHSSTENAKDISNEENNAGNITQNEVLNVAVYGCFTVTENKKISTNATCEEINLVIQNSINSTNSKIYSYKNAILLYYAPIREAFLSSADYKNLNEEIKQNLYDVGHIASIHFFNNENENRLHTIVNYNENVLNSSIPSETVQKLANRVLNLNGHTRNELIDICLNIFYLVYSQVHIDVLLKEKNYKNLHYTLDGCERQTLELKTLYQPLTAEQKVEIDEFLNFWLSHCERYRAIALIHEEQYHGAVSKIFKAITLNPFYPYTNYHSLKANYSKRYALELVPVLNEMQDMFQDIDVSSAENSAIAEELSEQIEFKDVPYHYIILKDIMYKNKENTDLISQIERELNKLPNNSPFILITKSEIIRFLKKGNKKISEIYASRLDDAIRYLRDATALDSDFPVLYNKLGSLLFMKGANSFSPKSLIESAEMYKRGGYFLTQLGFRTRPKPSD